MAGEVPKIVLIPHERSHPFIRRECLVTEPLKVGRSVDRRKIAQDNLIFDCRVLSRNHALISFENGKFYIKDTKSSNGTFVNENRLSPSAEESGMVELRSRDVVQFGVNVNVEKKITHGCIIATIRLFINDVELPGLDPSIQEVVQIVQSALSREQELENKLASMQEVLNAARQLATESMIATVREDELMSRLEMLENQLQVYSKNSSPDELKQKLTKAYEDKHKHETTTKDSLRTLLQEKLECAAKLNQLQRDYDKAEQECQKYRMLYDAAHQEHSQEVAKLSEQLRNAEKERKALEEKMAEEKRSLTANIEALQAEVTFTQNQLAAEKAHLQETLDELIPLRMKFEAEKQRKAIGMESVSTLDSVELPSPVGDEEESFREIAEHSMEVSQVVQHPVEEEAVQRVEPGVEAHAPGVPGLAMISNANLLPSLDSSDDDDDEVGETEAARLIELEMRVVSLEEELRMSEETVRTLQAGRQQDGPSSLLYMGSSKDGEEVTEGRIEALAMALSEAAIAKGQVEVLQTSLEEAGRQIRTLQAELETETRQCCLLKESITVSGGQLNHCYTELEAKHVTVIRMKGELDSGANKIASMEKEIQRHQSEVARLQSVNSGLQGELSSLRRRYSSKLQEGESVNAENAELRSRIETMQQRLQQHPQDQPHPPFTVVPRPQTPVEEDQKVKILMIVALVSIGVALASWLT